MTTDLHTELSAKVGAATAEALLTRAGKFSNFPNTVSGAAKLPSDPTAEAAALVLVEEPALGDELGLNPTFEPRPTQECWLLLTLAARADLTVLDRLAPILTEDYAVRLLASIRRAAVKHAKTQAVPPAPPTAAPTAPQKVSEVKKWLAARPEVDPQDLAPHDGQKAAARVAAIRALGTLATPAALAVLSQYAQDSYPDTMLKELHTAWGRFDRREFAATMFRQTPYALDLQVVTDLEGIDAVPDLTSLHVIFLGAADIGPIAQCSGLRRLRVRANEEPGLVSAEPLLGLTELRELELQGITRHADLSGLAGTGVEKLDLSLEDADGSFLLEMPNLKRLMLSAGRGGEQYRELQEIEPHEGVHEVVIGLARKGVQVTLHSSERPWVPAVALRAEAESDLFVVEKHGFVRITNDGSNLAGVESELFGNRLP